VVSATTDEPRRGQVMKTATRINQWNRVCLECKQDRKIFSVEHYANGLYGYYCQECDTKLKEAGY